MAGKKVAVIDFDVGLRNLDLIMGCERRVVYDFVNVMQGEATLKQALIKDKRHDNLYVLAASQTRDKDALTQEGVEKVLDDLSEDGLRLRRVRLPRRHRERRAPGDVFRRPRRGRGRTRKFPRCATPIAFSACSPARPGAPSAAKARSSNTCC